MKAASLRVRTLLLSFNISSLDTFACAKVHNCRLHVTNNISKLLTKLIKNNKNMIKLEVSNLR